MTFALPLSSVLWATPTASLQEYHFTFGAYRYPPYLLTRCKGGSPKFLLLLYQHSAISTPGSSSVLHTQHLHTFSRLHHPLRGSALPCPLTRTLSRRGNVHFMLRTADLLALQKRTSVPTLLWWDFSSHRLVATGLVGLYPGRTCTC